MLFGDPEDVTAAYLGWLAERRGVQVLHLSEAELGVGWTFLVDSQSNVTVVADGTPVPLADVTGAAVRLNPSPALPAPLDRDPGQPQRSHSPGAGGDRADGDPRRAGATVDGSAIAGLLLPERRAGLQYLLDALPCTVVNRPSRGRANGSKPVHMQQLSAAGFTVPAWLATNDLHRAEDALRCWPDGAVVKASSGLRSHVRRWDPHIAARFHAGTPPHVVQRYVPGHDVRVHVVGARAFASRVTAAVTDYRFDTDSADYAPCDPPDGVSARCVAYAQQEGLPLAGFDFRVDQGGMWYCLEMNPVPTFLPYEAATGQCIGDAIIDLLAPGTASPDPVSPLAVRSRM
jgi:hypothetical protein